MKDRFEVIYKEAHSAGLEKRKARWDEKEQEVVIGGGIIAAICFGIAGYGHFYRGRMALGCFFSILTAAQLAPALTNYIQLKKKSE